VRRVIGKRLGAVLHHFDSHSLLSDTSPEA
jgi:hypothetical protein